MQQPQQQRGAADLFARAVTRQAVAQAALAVGCKHSYSSVLDALTDLVQDFVQGVGLAAQAKAEAGGRTQVSTLDMMAALEEPPLHDGRDRYEVDWRALRGFAFSDMTNPERPEAFRWYQPFHTHIPPFPVPATATRKRAQPEEAEEEKEAAVAEEEAAEEEEQSEGEGNEEGRRRRRRRRQRLRRPAYVPAFLPPFPPEHTFRKTGIKARTKTEDPAAIQQQRIATKQLVLKAISRSAGGRQELAGAAEGEGPEADGAACLVVSLPQAAAGSPTTFSATGTGTDKANGGGAGSHGDEMQELDELFNAESQPFKPVVPTSAATSKAAGAAVGGAQS